MAKGSVAIIGGGIMGGDIATSFAAAGWEAHVMSPSEKTRAGLVPRVRNGLLRLGANPKAIELVEVYDDMRGLPWPGIGLVIEAVTEDMALKHRVFAAIEAVARPDIPLTTNTSSFPVTEIGRHLKTRHRLCGAHYFMPAHIVPLVEVVHAEFTDSAVPEQVAAVLESMGKVPVMVKKDIPGFLANRLQHALLREALWLVENGITSPEGIDAAVRYGFGFRFVACGPIMQKEMSGWDTNLFSGRSIYPSLSNATEPPAILRNMVERGALGMKARRGMWEWTDEAIAREKSRYEKALHAGFEILQSEESTK